MERRKRRSDMLSVLPDEVLCHILSFLSTSRSVRTSVLSKRWRFLWAHVPNLEFDRHTFRGTTVTKRQHLDIISRVVALHQAQTLNTFKLSKLRSCASSSSSSYRLHTLIINLVTKRNLRNLHLDLGVPCTLPRHLFACKTLVELELLSCGLIPSSGELIFLPSLKKMSLICVEYEDDESLPHLLSGCPVLEELTVKVGKDNPGSVIVSSSTVERLTVDFSLLAEEDCPDEMLVIDVPALGYLKVDRCNLDSCRSLEKTMTSLVEAEITLNGYSHTCADDCTEHGRAIAFVSCLCNARCLKISTDFAETLVDIVGTRWMPKFVNLTKLELVLIVNWYNVVKFLQFADNLEALTISLYEMPSYAEPRRVPPCMVSRLRTVTMYCFSPCEDAFETVRYVLKNARALERMEIYSQDGSSDKEDLDALRKISLFERGSASCQLDFNDVD